MFYGARRPELIKNISYYGLKVSIAFTSSLGLLFLIFPHLFLRIFTSDISLLGISSDYLRIDVFTFPLMAIVLISSRILQGMGLGLPGFIINFVRIFIFAVPLAYLFVFVLGYGYLSVAVAMVIGGIASSVVAIFLLKMKLNNQALSEKSYSAD